MQKIKENIREIIIFMIFILLLIMVAISPNRDVEDLKQIQRMRILKDSLEIEYYKKELKSYPYDHSEIKDTTESNGRK